VRRRETPESRQQKPRIMKKFWLLCLLLALVSQAEAANIKFLGGLGFSHYAVKPERYQGIDWDTGRWFRYERRDRQGFAVGAGVEFRLRRCLSLDVDGLYSEKGGRFALFYDDIPYQRLEYKLQVISVPVLLKLKFFRESTPYLLGGGELSCILAHKKKSRYLLPFSMDSIDHESNLRDVTGYVDFAATLGGGFEIKIGKIWVFVEARYLRGLFNILREESYPQNSLKTRSGIVLIGVKI
jgi:hypothetical protein